MTQGPPLPNRFRYHVVFSYAKDDKEYVEAVSAALPKEIERFLYSLEKSMAETLGRNLKKHLRHLYRDAAMYCVVFISKAYLKSGWTQLEWKVARSVDKRKPGYVIPVFLDDTQVPELDGLGRIERNTPAEKCARVLDDTIRRGDPKPWWFYVSTEVKVAAALLLLVLILSAKPTIDHFRPSRTSIALAAANEHAITAHVSNRGPKPSTLVGYRLRFSTLPIHDASLRLDKSEAATIPAHGKVDVDLKVLTLTPKCLAGGHRPNNEEIESMLDRHQVTLEVDVAESDDAPGKPSKRVATFPAKRLQPFVRKWVPSRVPPC